MKMRKEECDVCILGCGPGGSSAAVQLAQSGLSVVILERQQSPEMRSGETLHPGIEPLLDHLGIGDSFRGCSFARVEGIWTEWGASRRFIRYGQDEEGRPWMGFQADRNQFDNVLSRAVEAAGARIHFGEQATSIRQQDDGCLVQSANYGWRCRYVIDGTGRRQWLANQLRLPVIKRSPKLIARYGYTPEQLDPIDHLPMISGDDNGWTWTSKVRDGLFHRTRLCFDGDANWKKWFREFDIRRVRGADVTWRCVTRTAGPGYFLVGDAACVVDPASSHGVIRAIMTGMMAAKVIQQINANLRRGPTLMDGYSRWLCDWFSRDAVELKRFYRQLSSPPAWLGTI